VAYQKDLFTRSVRRATSQVPPSKQFMYKFKRLLKSIFRLVLPIIILVVVACVSASIWLVQKASRVQPVPYLVTPAKYGLLSARGAQVTEEKWTNKDGTSARGWLLRGSDNAPAVILLHKFGADRSYELDLGVKLNEATNFTVLMPDLRGHGESPVVDVSAFGGHETDDTLSAVDFLRNLKTPDGVPLVGAKIGVYGVELGSLAALGAAVKDPSISAVALDSVPTDSTAVIAAAVERRFPFGSSVTSELARLGARLYFYKGSFENLSTCDAGKAIGGRKIMLLSGFDVPELQASTTKFGHCIQSGPNVETKYDLSPSGYNIINASLEKSQDYEQRVIDFFRLALAS
jgi:pimeloyl-ACP methyl ester carboxylesterase